MVTKGWLLALALSIVVAAADPLYNCTVVNTIPIPSEPGSVWKGIACSADGSLLNGGGISNVLTSRDGGASWGNVYRPPPPHNISEWWSAQCSSDTGKYLLAGSTDPDDQGTAMYSTDYGVNWNIAPIGYKYFGQFDSCAISGGTYDVMLVVCSQGL